MLITTKDDLGKQFREARAAGRRIGLVPTMGALHAGHLSLLRASQAECDFHVATIFVNPTQFGPNEDLARYPRTLAADLEQLAAAGTSLVFAPPAELVYPPGFSTYVEPPTVAARWEGTCRPGHFRGVATVVLKLLHLIPADVAFFGQKDYQQSRVIQQMVVDLDLPIQIQVCPTVREPDGLAMSSRNRYLDPGERRRATSIFRGLCRAAEMFESGERAATRIESEVRRVMQAGEITRIEYIAVADPETLEPLDRIERSAVVLIAARVGSTRLIDNRLLSREDA